MPAQPATPGPPVHASWPAAGCYEVGASLDVAQALRASALDPNDRVRIFTITSLPLAEQNAIGVRDHERW